MLSLHGTLKSKKQEMQSWHPKRDREGIDNHDTQNVKVDLIFNIYFKNTSNYIENF